MDDFPDAKGEASSALSADTAYELIQRMIVTGELPAYELLSEKDLCRRTDCGRTPVRDALQRLKFEGFVTVMPRRGIMVTPVDLPRQLELLETRRPLEELMVTLATRHATDAQRDEMRRLADELEQAIANRDRESYLLINRAIHKIEAEATQNRYLVQQIGMIHSLSRRFWYSFISDTNSFALAGVHHAAVLRAIADQDREGAKRECHRLLDLLEVASQQAIRSRLDPEGRVAQP